MSTWRRRKGFFICLIFLTLGDGNILLKTQTSGFCLETGLCNLIWIITASKVTQFRPSNLLTFSACSRFHVTVLLFSISWLQNVARAKKWCVSRYVSMSLMFLPHFDVFFDLLLNRHMAAWNLFVLYKKEVKKLEMTSFMHLPSNRS